MAIAKHQESCDLAYFAWADCPFLDSGLAGRLADRHIQYTAEYSYADGWPYGLAPELLAPGTAAILAKIIKDDDDIPVERDVLFWAIQKDINAFDIETEISPIDLRCHRLNFCADSKRNLLLLSRFVSACDNKLPDTPASERIIAEKPEILRTLPAFFPIQVYSGCPQSCTLCPYPKIMEQDLLAQKEYMETSKFKILLDRICDFCGDAVIDLSLWGELALHPQKITLIKLVLERPSLSLIIETSGIGWKPDELEFCAELSRNAAASHSGNNSLPPLSWIVSLDTLDAQKYRELRGAGFNEAMETAKKLLALFPRNTYIQAVRTAGAEDDIEKFYRTWKESTDIKNIIIQKYDDFCGFLKRLQASDISPVIRQPCWHLMRDMPVLLDGSVPLCRDDMQTLAACNSKSSGKGTAVKCVMGNVFTDTLEKIWENGYELYKQQCHKEYPGNCAVCDEYYTYNF